MLMLLGSLSNAATTGVFSFAFKLSTLPDFVASSVKAPAAPLISQLFWQRKYTELGALLQRSVRLVALFSIPASLGLLLFAHPVMRFGGHEMVAGVATLQLLVLVQLVNSLSGLTGVFLNMTNHQLVLLQIMVPAVLLNLGAAY